MYKISHDTDAVEVIALNSDAEFVHFVRNIAVENGDEDFSITCIGEARDYFDNYCNNLSLV